MTQRNFPESAFILAAGKGTRLRPHTIDKPKPMVAVKNQPIIKHIIDKLALENIHNITVNANYLSNILENYLNSLNIQSLHFSHEKKLLDTGGGVKNALHAMRDQPFFLINGDAFWIDEVTEQSALKQLSDVWDNSKMDILLLLQSTDKMTLTKPVGDYHIDDGMPVRAKDSSGTHMFTGIRIVHPRIFQNYKEDCFSFLECMDKAEHQRRLHAVEYQNGIWHHISTPEDLEAVNSGKRVSQNYKAA